MKNLNLQVFILFIIIAGTESSTCSYKKLTTSRLSTSTSTLYKTAYRYCANGCCSSGILGCCSSTTVYSYNWIWYSVGGGISGLIFLIVIIVIICVACRRRSHVTTVVGTPSAGGVAVVNTNAMQQQVPMSSFGGTTNYAYGVPTGYPYNPPNTAGYPVYNGQPQPQPQPPVQTGPPAHAPGKTFKTGFQPKKLLKVAKVAGKLGKATIEHFSEEDHHEDW